ncbi:AAA family ATPase [Pedobacter terrae]|uniref:AAA family ATPase n=1 Tax=Pedobacter terrae TaxID=405671 RepID=UPI002FF75650
MIKIDHYRVNGFKNLESVDVSLNNMNVIIGPNNSGKSNFLQSISFLNYIVNGSTDDLEKSFLNGFRSTHFNGIIPFNKLYADEAPKKDKILFELKFSNTNTNNNFRYELGLEYNNGIFNDTDFKIISESLEAKEFGKPGKATNIFSRKKSKIKFGSDLGRVGAIKELPDYLSVVRLLKIIPGNKQFSDAANTLNSIIKTPTFYFSNTELMKSDTIDRVNVFNGRTVAFDLEKEIIGMENGDQWDIFTNSVRNILNIDGVFIHTYSSKSNSSKEDKKEQKFLYFDHFGSLKSVDQMSDGTILIIALITKILTSHQDVFFIEEPENSIHPKALIDLFGFLQSFTETKQFVISSHSIALLNKTQIDDILTSSVLPNGTSEILNVSDRKILKSRLKSAYVNFSDELFFGVDPKDEFN